MRAAQHSAAPGSPQRTAATPAGRGTRPLPGPSRRAPPPPWFPDKDRRLRPAAGDHRGIVFRPGRCLPAGQFLTRAWRSATKASSTVRRFLAPAIEPAAQASRRFIAADCDHDSPMRQGLNQWVADITCRDRRWLRLPPSCLGVAHRLSIGFGKVCGPIARNIRVCQPIMLDDVSGLWTPRCRGYRTVEARVDNLRGSLRDSSDAEMPA